MRHHELVEIILDAFAELATLHAAAAAAAERAWSVLSEHEDLELRGVACGQCRHRQLAVDRPRVDAATFTVEWHGRRCDLGPGILFKLLQRLSRHADRYYPYSILMTDVWERRCSKTTVRSAVKRLRRALCEGGMDDLADAIKGRGECYGLFLNGDGL
jgi:DNA-binding response OmpR family regulator